MSVNTKKISGFIENLLKDINKKVVKIDDKDYIEAEKKFKKELLESIVTIKTSLEDKKLSVTEAVEIILELCDLVGTTKFFLYIEDEDDKLNYINSLISAVYNNEDALGNPNISFLPDFLEDHVENFMLNVIIPAMVKYVIKKL